MQRRTLLKLGFGSAALLAVAGGGIAWWHPGLQAGGRLSPGGRAVFRAVAQAVLDGALDDDAARRAGQLDGVLDRLDATLQALPPGTRGELSMLLALLSAPPGRLALAGVRPDWPDADLPTLQAALHDMNASRLTLRNQAYHAMRDLSLAAFYADPASWARIGYPGPVSI